MYVLWLEPTVIDSSVEAEVHIVRPVLAFLTFPTTFDILVLINSSPRQFYSNKVCTKVLIITLK